MTVEAFNQVVCVHLDAMYRTALAISGNSHDAADAVQNASIKLWEKRHTLEGVANMQAYCVGAARNAAISLIRGRRPTNSLDEALTVSTEASPERDIEVGETNALIMSILAQLPINQRTVFTMRDIEGCEFEEIQKATGLSATNVRVLLSRARSSIRKHFNK